MENNGAQDRSNFATSATGTATPTNVNETPTVPTAPFCPIFASHMVIHNIDNRVTYEMPTRSQSGGSTPVGENEQNSQQEPREQPGLGEQPGPRAQSDFGGQQAPSPNAQHLSRVFSANANAMTGLAQLYSALPQQLGIQTPVTQHQQSDQNDHHSEDQQFLRIRQPANLGDALQLHQSSGTAEPIKETTSAQNTPAVCSSHHTSVAPFPQAVSGNEASNPSHVGTIGAGQPPLATQITQEFQDRVGDLVAHTATTFKGHIQNDADFALYEMAAWKAKRKDVNIENKSQGYPEDRLGKMHIKQRIFNAIQNIDGAQDPAAEAGTFENCLAVKTVRGLSDLETEILAHKLMEEMRKVQCGEPVPHLPTDSKLVQEPSFTDKVDQVVEALSYNKPLCRNLTQAAEWVARIAADPASERARKRQNHKNNKDKNAALKKDAAARGKSRNKGKEPAALDGLEADTTRESSAEVYQAIRSSHAQA